jgi:hypothetical protein
MGRHRFSLLAVSLLGLLACQEGTLAPESARTGTLTGTPLALTRFSGDSMAYAAYSGVRAPSNMVIRDATAWSELWQNIHALTEPVPPLPNVDFSEEMIVAVALGTRPTGGFNVFLADAAESSDVVQIEVIETRPGSDCITTQALTQPVDLARVARRDAPVQFVIVQLVQTCGS